MKKFVAVLLALLLLVTVLPLQVFAEEEQPDPNKEGGELPISWLSPEGVKVEVTLDKPAAARGEEIVATFTITENEGIKSFSAVPAIDTSVLKVKSVSYCEEFEAAQEDSTTFTFSDPFTGTGVVYTLTLTVRDTAAVGNTSVGLTVFGATNAKEEDITDKVTVAEAALSIVAVKVTAIQIDPTELTVKTAEGENTGTLTVSTNPGNAEETGVTWTSSDDTVATVSGTGLTGTVTGLKKGTVTITATHAHGAVATATVTVECSHVNTTEYQAVASTCTTQGHAAYTVCDDCGEVISGSSDLLPLDPNNHNYGAATYVWAADNTTCTASHTCAYDEAHVETETVDVSKQEVTPAGCETPGETKYTATFTKAGFGTQEQTLQDIPAQNHDWNDPEYLWNDDYTQVTATRTCKRNPAEHSETETVDVVSAEVTTPATHGAMGKTTYTSAAFKNEAFEVQTITVENVPVLTWKYGDANNDDKVDTADLIRLANYLADNTVVIGEGADANGDGTVNADDLTLLLNYFAAYDFTIPAPGTVTLGPEMIAG